MIAPPHVRPTAVVDPRIGDLGPALLALEDGTIFSGVAFGAPVASGGDLVVNTSQTGYQEVCTDPSYAGQVVVMTYPLIGNYGRLIDDDQSVQPWLRGPRRGQCHGRGPRRCAAAGIPPADQRHSRDRRRRHAGAGAPSPDHRVAARDPHGAGRAVRGGCFGGRARRSALGGPGLRRAGLAGVDRGRRQAGRRRSTRRNRRLRPQVEHRPKHAAAWRPGAHPAPHDLDLGCPRGGHRRGDPVAGAG